MAATNDDNGAVPEVERAHQRVRDPAAQTLAAAFSRDPFFGWLLAADDGERRLLPLFRAMLGLELAKPCHVVDLVDGGAGVALWHDVDRWQPSARDSIRLLQAAAGAYGTRLRMAGRVKSIVDAAHPAEPHRYLAYIGVQPARQGSGLGRLMLASATARCDQDGVAAYLENLNPRNAPLYHRAGFADRGLIDLPDGAPPVMAMWRDPA